MSVNVVVISGNLTRDPELRAMASGMQVMKFTVAVNDRTKDQSGQWVDRPNFVDCTMFGERAQKLSQYLRKGLKVTVNGSLRWSSWESNGQKRSKLEVIAKNIELPPRQQGQQGYQQQPNQSAQTMNPTSFYDEDIPF